MTNSMDDKDVIAVHSESGAKFIVDKEDKEFFEANGKYTLRESTPEDERDIANSVSY